jgi:hypothetical protein
MNYIVNLFVVFILATQIFTGTNSIISETGTDQLSEISAYSSEESQEHPTHEHNGEPCRIAHHMCQNCQTTLFGPSSGSIISLVSLKQFIGLPPPSLHDDLTPPLDTPPPKFFA